MMVNRNQGSGTRALIDRLLGGAQAARLRRAAAESQCRGGRGGAGPRRLGHDPERLRAAPASDSCRCRREQYDFIVPRVRAKRPGRGRVQDAAGAAGDTRSACPPGNDAVRRPVTTRTRAAAASFSAAASPPGWACPKPRCPSAPRRCCNAWCGCSARVVSPIIVVAAREQVLPALPDGRHRHSRRARGSGGRSKGCAPD